MPSVPQHPVPLTPEPLTYTLRQVAQLTGLTEGSLRKRVFDGQIAVIRVGRRVLVPREVLMRLLDRDR